MSGIQKSETAPKRIKGNALIGCFLKREKKNKKKPKKRCSYIIGINIIQFFIYLSIS